MSLNANKAAGGGRQAEPLDAGTYPARLVQVVALGLQNQKPYQGKEKPPVEELMVTYEFVDEFMKDEEGNDVPEKPRWKSETFPFYNLSSEKAKSTLRYNALDPSGVKSGDWAALIGTPCLVTITHNPKQGGGVYDNITAVSTMREKDADRLPPLVNEPKVFDLESPDMDVFGALPKWIQQKITENLEFEGSALQKILGTEGPAKEADSGEDVDDVLEGDENRTNEGSH